MRIPLLDSAPTMPTPQPSGAQPDTGPLFGTQTVAALHCESAEIEPDRGCLDLDPVRVLVGQDEIDRRTELPLSVMKTG